MEFTALVPEMASMGERVDLANMHSHFLMPSFVSITNVESDIDKSNYHVVKLRSARSDLFTLRQHPRALLTADARASALPPRVPPMTPRLLQP